MTVRSFFSYERERFVDDLLGYMTLEEKLGQLNLFHSAQDPGLEAAIAAGRVGGVAEGGSPTRLQALATEHSRMGIPLLFHGEPIPPLLSPWALAASWDENLARQFGAMAADAALRAGANCLPGPRVVLCQTRQAAAGALVATGQAHLAARLIAAFAHGAHRSEPGASNSGLAIPVIEGNRNAALRCGLELAFDGEVMAVDCPTLDRETALNAGFAGLLVAECKRLTATLADQFATTSARSSIEAAEKALADGLIGKHEIDAAVRGVLAVKHALGLFRRGERTFPAFPGAGELPARAEIARRSMVLLRNESGLLPLSPVSDRVLVVGASDGAGGACAAALSRAGIGHSVAPGLALRRGAETWSEPVAGDQFALSLTREAAQRADFVLVALEERHFVERHESGWRQPATPVLTMLRTLSILGSRLVALVATDEPVDLAEADQHFSAVLQCWGQEPGFEEALADILSGRHSPQGRMPVTAGRFEFGQGLGFGESVFSSLKLTAGSDHLAASIRVRNSGSFTARETVQAYVRSGDAELRLVGFDHVTLAPGEDVPVRFELGSEALSDPGPNGRLDVVPGSREISVGKNIGRLLSARFDVSPALAAAIDRQNLRGRRVAAG